MANIRSIDESKFPGNTKLHDAIHENDTALALTLITNDVINTFAMGNSPLIFALKKGNISVARAILKYSNVDIHAKDNHGLTALHWACMLRRDDVIGCLLDLGADPHLTVDPLKNFNVGIDLDEDHAINPLAVYTRNICLENFTNYWYADTVLPPPVL